MLWGIFTGRLLRMFSTKVRNRIGWYSISLFLCTYLVERNENENERGRVKCYSKRERCQNSKTIYVYWKCVFVFERLWHSTWVESSSGDFSCTFRSSTLWPTSPIQSMEMAGNFYIYNHRLFFFFSKDDYHHMQSLHSWQVWPVNEQKLNPWFITIT